MEQQVLFGDDIYEVEEIVGMKKADGRWLYRVHWKGYSSHSDTWEPEENLLLCRDMIEEYTAKISLKNSRKNKPELSLEIDTFMQGNNFSEAEVKSLSSSSNPLEPHSDTFWKDLAEGRVCIIDEDMYSRVKGRAAKRSQKALDLKQPASPSSSTSSTSDSNESIQRNSSRQRKSGVLQTLSQSFDNSMKPLDVARHLKKEKKYWGSIASRSRNISKSSTMKVEQVNCAPGKVMLKIKGHKIEKTSIASLNSENKSSLSKISINETNAILLSGKEKMHSCDGDRLSDLVSFQELLSAIEEQDCGRVIDLFSHHNQILVQALPHFVHSLMVTAVISGHWKIIEALIQQGIDVNSTSVNGTTPIMVACQNGHSEIVKHLLEKGAHKDLQDSSGLTPLMIASSLGHNESVCHLLDCGANFAAVNRAGLNALRLARLSRRSDSQQILTSHISQVTAAFEQEVRVTVSNTANIIHALFPLHCFSVSEKSNFKISFDHECQDLNPGMGYLLFIAHANVAFSKVHCRLYGSCSVQTVLLNNNKQPSLTEGANFVFSFCPLSNGKNELTIITNDLPQSKEHILVCAYQAELVKKELINFQEGS